MGVAQVDSFSAGLHRPFWYGLSHISKYQM